MRQQLITWLIDEIAPDIRRSSDAEGTILKFAKERNLAPALVQALGQLYNTAKTLAFLEKAGSKGRGDSFPILDVDDLVKKFLEAGPVKSAGVAEGTIDTWELDNPFGGDLPACFAGITTPALTEETVVNTVPDRLAKRAAVQRAIHSAEMELAQQICADYEFQLDKLASAISQSLRENPDYPWQQFEADALGYFAKEAHMKGVLDKVFEFCTNCSPRLKVDARAKKATAQKLLNEFETSLMEKLAAIDDLFFKRAAAYEFMEQQKSAMVMEPPPKVEEALNDWTIPLGGSSEAPPDIGADLGKPSPGIELGGDASPGSKSLRTKGTGPKGEKPVGGRGDAGGSLFNSLNAGLDKLLGATASGAAPIVRGMMGGRNSDQELVDRSMQDARQIAVLQNLLTTDEILSEADPDRVVQIYNTVRESAPELAGDINVMRVLLRSAIQHDGIAPFDLKGILETELAKQKVDWNRRITSDVDYGGAKPPVPNKPM